MVIVVIKEMFYKICVVSACLLSVWNVCGEDNVVVYSNNVSVVFNRVIKS